MKLLLFGATGGTGRELIKQALEQNHVVTAFARNPDDIKIKDNRLRVVDGDIIDYDSILACRSGPGCCNFCLGCQHQKEKYHPVFRNKKYHKSNECPGY